MKVAIIIERFDIALGGAERSVSELADELSNMGIEVDILAAKGESQSQNIHILCHNHNSKRTSLDVFEKEISLHIQQHKYDIVHSTLPISFADVYQPRGGSFAEAIRQNARSYQNRFLVEFKQLTSLFNIRRNKMLMAEKNLCRKNSKLIVAALSNYVRHQFVSHYNFPDARIKVIANGVKVEGEIEQTRIDKAKTILPPEWNKPGNAVFVFAANNFRLKGLDCLLKAWSKMIPNNTSRTARLIVAGRDKRINCYRNYADKLGLNDKVQFAGSVEDIRGLLAVCNAAVLPTFYDPASRFILEAISLNIPSITTRYNGSSEFIAKPSYGIVIDSAVNISALARAVKDLCGTEIENKIRQSLKEDKLYEKVSIKRHCRQLLKLYEQIVN